MTRMGLTVCGQDYRSLDYLPDDPPVLPLDWVFCCECKDAGCSVGNYNGRTGGCRAGTRRALP